MATNDTSATPTPDPNSGDPTTAPRAARAPRTPRRARSAAVAPVAKTPVEQAQSLAQRAVLIPLGAALEARDRVVDAIDEVRAATRSRSAIDRHLSRFERRGGRARTDLEAQARRHRTTLESRARDARSGIDHQRDGARRAFDGAVQSGRRLVADAQDRLSRIA